MGILEQFNANTDGTQPLEAQSRSLAKTGRRGDTQLAHLNNREIALLDANTKGGGSINPTTGLMEFGEEGDGGGYDGDFDWSGDGVTGDKVNDEYAAALEEMVQGPSSGPGYDTLNGGALDDIFGKSTAEAFGAANNAGYGTFADLASQSYQSGLTGNAASLQDGLMQWASQYENVDGSAEAFGNQGFQGVQDANAMAYYADLAEQAQQIGFEPQEDVYGEISKFDDPNSAFFSNPNGQPMSIAQMAISSGLSALTSVALPGPVNSALNLYGAGKGINNVFTRSAEKGISPLQAALERAGINDLDGINAAFQEQINGVPNDVSPGFIQSLGNRDLQGAIDSAKGTVSGIAGDLGLNFDDPNFGSPDLGPETSPGGTPIAVTSESIADINGPSTFDAGNTTFNANTMGSSFSRADEIVGSPLNLDPNGPNAFNNNGLTQSDLSSTPQSPISSRDALANTTSAFQNSLANQYNQGNIQALMPRSSIAQNDWTFIDNFNLGNNPQRLRDNGSVADIEELSNLDQFFNMISNFDDRQNNPDLDDATFNTNLQEQLQSFQSSDIFQRLQNDPAQQATLLNSLFNQLEQGSNPDPRDVIGGSFQDVFNRRNDPRPEQVPRDFRQEVTDILTRPGFNQIDQDNEAITPDQQINKLINNDVIDLNSFFEKDPTGGLQRNTNALSGLTTEEILRFGREFSGIVDDSSLGATDIATRLEDFKRKSFKDIATAKQNKADQTLNVQAAIDAFTNAQTGFDAQIEERGLTGQGFATQGKTDLLNLLRDFVPGAGQVNRFNSTLNDQIGRDFATNALSNTRNRFVDFGTSQIEGAFPDSGFELDQSIIDSIVNERLSTGSEIIGNQEARGNFNSIGAANANEQLETQRPRINDAVFGTASSFIPGIDSFSTDLRGRAQEANQGFQLGDELFNIQPFQEENDTFFDAQNSGFRGQVDEAIGSDPLFNIGDALAAGRRSQGSVSGPEQGSVLDSLAARESAGVANRTNRGLGTRGSGAF